MALIYADRVKETSTTTGTGTYSLAGAVGGFRTFVAGVGNGNTCYYCATDGTDWEVGLGTITDSSPDTLARTTILASSNGGAAVNWGGGTRTIYGDIPASAVAGQAITDLGVLTAGQVADGDLVPIVDVSDTTQSAAGSTKAISRLNLIDPNNVAAYAAGTVYVLTGSMAKVDFGTTDPAITVSKAGTYLLLARAVIKYNGATFAASQTLTLKLRRTNNTAADVSNSSTARNLGVVTGVTDGFEFTLPPVFYTTANANDAIELQGQLSAVPSAGSMDVVEASITAVRVF